MGTDDSPGRGFLMDTCPMCRLDTRSDARARMGARVVCYRCEAYIKTDPLALGLRQMTLTELS